MLFKARQGDGTYMFGTKQTVPEEGSRWAFNPTMIQRGYVCFGDGGKKLGERLLPITQPMLDPATLPDRGFPWVEQWAVNMKCLERRRRRHRGHLQDNDVRRHSGRPGLLLGAIRDRLNGGQHDGKVVADRAPGEGLLQTTQYGQHRKPVFTIVDWMPLNGPAPRLAAAAVAAGPPSNHVAGASLTPMRT